MLLNKQKFSGSTNGRQIKLAAVGTPGTLIHTAQAGTADDTFDEIWLWAMNNDAVSRVLTVEFGGVAAPDDQIQLTLASLGGLILIVPGLVLQNSLVVRAYGAAANVINVSGFVNKISP